MDFGSIVKRGQKLFKAKDKGGTWGRCEHCEERMLLYRYEDEKYQPWMLCENCIEILSKDE
jgi:hypothetical protein